MDWRCGWLQPCGDAGVRVRQHYPSAHCPCTYPHLHLLLLLSRSSTLFSLYQRVLESELDTAVKEDLGPRLWRSFYYPCIETLRRQLQRPASAEGGGCGIAVHCTSGHMELVCSASPPCRRQYW